MGDAPVAPLWQLQGSGQGKGLTELEAELGLRPLLFSPKVPTNPLEILQEDRHCCTCIEVAAEGCGCRWESQGPDRLSAAVSVDRAGPGSHR